MSYTIITHAGKSHLDEILASAFLALHLGELPENVERLHSADAAKLVNSGDYNDSTYFIDCGMQFDSEKKLFDHHQDRDLPSAALMLFNAFFSHLRGTELEEIVELISRVDTRGPRSLNDFEDIDESRKYFNFGQKFLMRYFENDPIMVIKIFMDGLEDKIAFELARQEATKWLEVPGNVEIQDVLGASVLKYNKRPPLELASALRSADGGLVDEHEVQIILSYDDKDEEARCLFRTDKGYETVDFTRSNPQKELFCHQGGFLLRFIPRDEDEWIELAQRALK